MIGDVPVGRQAIETRGADEIRVNLVKVLPSIDSLSSLTTAPFALWDRRAC
jgi:hypothetical protein